MGAQLSVIKLLLLKLSITKSFTENALNLSSDGEGGLNVSTFWKNQIHNQIKSLQGRCQGLGLP